MTELDKARLDAWITREPPDDCCPKCDEPYTWTVETVTCGECSGQQVVQRTYTESDHGILDIIGWEHLGQVYEDVYSAPCGNDAPHPAHPISDEIETRTCGCRGEEA